SPIGASVGKGAASFDSKAVACPDLRGRIARRQLRRVIRRGPLRNEGDPAGISMRREESLELFRSSGRGQRGPHPEDEEPIESGNEVPRVEREADRHARFFSLGEVDSPRNLRVELEGARRVARDIDGTTRGRLRGEGKREGTLDGVAGYAVDF